MKILAVADKVEERLYSSLIKQAYPDVDLLVSCGDLPYEYLEFILTILNVPLLYVPGNHDPDFNERDPRARVDGATNIDQKLLTVKGLNIAGLGGSIRYLPHGTNQYSQNEMYWRAFPLLLPLIFNRIRKRPLDLLITHSPPAGIHDDDDYAHQGMHAINLLVKWFKPRYLLHGHTYYYRPNLVPPVTDFNGTNVIHILPYRLVEINHAK